MNCDKCKHYHWYYDWCDKWKCEVDARSVHSCYESEEVDLKPCPFCGRKAVIQQSGVNIMETNRDSVRFDFSIRCVNCKATAPGAYGYISAKLSNTGELNVWHDDRSSAAEAWNRRAQEGEL